VAGNGGLLFRERESERERERDLIQSPEVFDLLQFSGGEVAGNGGPAGFKW
jgi:hypothetical protein